MSSFPDNIKYIPATNEDDRYFVDTKSIIPSNESMQYFLWFKEFANEENDVAKIHLAITNQLYTKRDTTATTKVYECFRGSAKSTVISVYSPIYWAFLGRKPDLGIIHLVYVVSASISIARSHIQHIYSLVTKNEKLSSVLKVVKYREAQNPIIKLQNEDGHILTIEAKAPDQKQRGVKEDGNRVDVIILDDLEDKTNVSTPEQRSKIKDYYNKVLLPMLNPKTRDVHFIQTPLHTDSLLSLLKSGKNNMVIRIPICYNFDPNGNIKEDDLTWGDRFGIAEIMAIYQSYIDTNDIQSFNQEFLLELIGKEDIAVDFNDFIFINIEDIPQEVYERLIWFLSVDFGTNDNKNTDKYGYTALGVDVETGKWYIFYLEECDIEFTASIDKIFKIIEMIDPDLYWGLVVEKGAIWNIAENMVYNKEIEKNIYLDIYTLSKNNSSKLSVIKTLKPRAKIGNIYIVNQHLYPNGVETLKYQLSKISTTRIMSKHDDLVDSLAQMSLVKDASILSSIEKKQDENDDDYNDIDINNFKNPYKKA